MPTYVYETIPNQPGQEVEHFEVKQSMNEPALEKHPETGVPVRRVILGGNLLIKQEAGSANASSGSSCGCGPLGCF
ncbi:MAG: zinc ribbon domain-containing protein [Verrucomicrobiales bacterium]